MTLSLIDGKVPETVIDPEKNFADELIGDGKKYKDVGAAANAIVHKDAHIERIERENREMREDLARVTGELHAHENIEAVVDRLTARPQVSPISEPPVREPAQPSLTPENLETLLDQREEAKRQRTNVSTATEHLKTVYGGNYEKVLQDKANEIGVGLEFLTGVAAKNPKALYRLIGAPETPPTVTRQQDVLTAPPRSTQSFQPVTNKRNWDYYETLRKTKPAEYHTVKTQNEMMKDALELREAFYQK